MFVVKIIIVIIKVFVNIFDICDNDGMFRGGNLKWDEKKKKNVGLLDKFFLYFIIKKWIMK